MHHESAIKAFLKYSFEPIDYDYDKLTKTEQGLVTREEFAALTRWTRAERPQVIKSEIPMTPALTDAFGPLEGFTWMDKEEEDTLKGTVIIFGVHHHVTLVRVHYPDGVQTGTRDPHNRLEDILAGAEHAGQTVEVPGFEGEWVVGVDPYRR
jgi:hypothetical protein